VNLRSDMAWLAVYNWHTRSVPIGIAVAVADTV
jgi:hypothetical protein